MKKLTALILVLAMSLALAACGCDHVWLAATCDTPKTCEECGETEGEPKGHTMVEATCEEPKHCENCDLTEGEALGHTWVDATTEAPKTCENCGATEGERIITDPRFTTAATKELYGKWVMEIPFDGERMNMPDFPEGAAMNINMFFGNSGEFNTETTVTDNFAELLVQYTTKTLYESFAEQGMDTAAVDSMFESDYGMSVQAYVEQLMGSMNVEQMMSAITDAANIDGVYYVQDGQLYTGTSWEEDLVPEGFTLEGDTMTMESFTEMFGEEYVFVRVIE